MANAPNNFGMIGGSDPMEHIIVINTCVRPSPIQKMIRRPCQNVNMEAQIILNS